MNDYTIILFSTILSAFVSFIVSRLTIMMQSKANKKIADEEEITEQEIIKILKTELGSKKYAKGRTIKSLHKTVNDNGYNKSENSVSDILGKMGAKSHPSKDIDNQMLWTLKAKK